jgi:hypothetical protein
MSPFVHLHSLNTSGQEWPGVHNLRPRTKSSSYGSVGAVGSVDQGYTWGLGSSNSVAEYGNVASSHVSELHSK